MGRKTSAHNKQNTDAPFVRQPPQENESVSSGGWLIIFKFATALRCFAERYAPVRRAE